MKKLLAVILLSIMITMFSGCGGGGGSVAPPTKAVIKLSTKAPTGTVIGSLDVKIKMPPGVSAKIVNSSTIETAAGVVVLSGVTSGLTSMIGTYTNQSGSATEGTVRVLIPSTLGYPAGEFATITADIASGYLPVSADFNQITAILKDLNGADINEVTIEYSVLFGN